jgi:hypothetical protein
VINPFSHLVWAWRHPFIEGGGVRERRETSEVSVRDSKDSRHHDTFILYYRLALNYKLARNRKIPRPHIFTLGRLAFGVVVPAGAFVPEGEGFEVAAPLADEVGDPAEFVVELAEPDEAEPDGAVPAPVPGKTW